jgi:DHA2 family metal-tetracycline-proton antiporter-like MFS transporter
MTEAAPRPFVPARRLLPLMGIYIFLAVSNGTMVNVALPYIGAAFDASATDYGWVVSGFMLTFGVLGAVVGRLSDRFGLRRLYLLSVIAFCVLGLLNAVAPSLGALIFFRILQGAGAAAMPTLGATMLVRLTPEKDRGMMMGALGGIIGIAASVGPVLGGVLVQAGSWRLVFVVPALGLLAVPLIPRIIPDWVDEPQNTARLDIVGAAMLVLGAASLMLFATLSRTHGLFAPIPLGLLVFGTTSLAALGWWIHNAKAPFIPPELLRNTAFVGAVMLAGLANACRFGSLVLVPIFLVDLSELSPLSVGLVLLPGALAMTAMAPLAGKLADRGFTRPMAVAGIVMIIFGCVVTAFFAGGAPGGVAGGMMLFGAGYAFVQSPMLTAATRALPDALMGTGNGLFMMGTFLGAASGALAGVVALDWVPAVSLLLTSGGAYTNALLALGLLAAPALLLVPLIQGRDPD